MSHTPLWPSHGDPLGIFAPGWIVPGHPHTALVIVVLNLALFLFVIVAITGLQLRASLSANPRAALPSLGLRGAARRRRFSQRSAARGLAGVRVSR
jgi:hypothetical protein